MANEETIKMIIQFYNMQAGTRLKVGNEYNQQEVVDALAVNDDPYLMRAHIKQWIKENPDNLPMGFSKCMRAYRNSVAKKEVAEQATVTTEQTDNALSVLEKVVTKAIVETQQEKIEAQIMAGVEKKVRDFIEKEYGSIERKVTTIIDGVPKKIEGVQHERFDTVLKFVANNIPVFLTGPAGSGKNVLCKQIAEALGLKFYFTNAVTQEYKLTGFTDAMGHYQPTQFYKAFTEGGVFMLDEMDASIPEVLVILNAAIANKYFDFPAPIGYVEAHPDFRVIAAGNTTGHGADFNYVGRNQLDMASLDRFALVEIEYSRTIEDSVAGDINLACFCRDFRNAAKKAGVQIVVSYRAIGMLAKMLHLLTMEEALKTCLVKGLERDDINMICENISEDSDYKRTLKSIARAA